jgi:hypothetical protein|tara:strand:- start:1023 stop:1238 length:216 start_codon:yes stop_codon:yes gene_type:complete
MKTRLVIREGKVVELKEEDLREEKVHTFGIGKASGLKWGHRGYPETRISTNEKGQRRIFKETPKKSKYYIK